LRRERAKKPGRLASRWPNVLVPLLQNMMCLFEDRLQAEASCRIAWRPTVPFHTEIDRKRDERHQARANRNGRPAAGPGRLSAGRAQGGVATVAAGSASAPHGAADGYVCSDNVGKGAGQGLQPLRYMPYRSGWWRFRSERRVGGPHAVHVHRWEMGEVQVDVLRLPLLPRPWTPPPVGIQSIRGLPATGPTGGFLADELVRLLCGIKE
jgi:hypothetical protein